LAECVENEDLMKIYGPKQRGDANL